MTQLDADETVSTWSRATDRIPYVLDGKLRHYIPDLDVRYVDGRRCIEEIKPQALIDSPSAAPMILAKAEAARAFYSRLGVTYRFVTEHDLGDDILAFDGGGPAGLESVAYLALRKERSKRHSKRWYHANADRIRRECAKKGTARYRSMPPSEKALFREKQNAQQRAKWAADPEFRAKKREAKRQRQITRDHGGLL